MRCISDWMMSPDESPYQISKYLQHWPPHFSQLAGSMFRERLPVMSPSSPDPAGKSKIHTIDQKYHHMQY